MFCPPKPPSRTNQNQSEPTSAFPPNAGMLYRAGSNRERKQRAERQKRHAPATEGLQTYWIHYATNTTPRGDGERCCRQRGRAWGCWKTGHPTWRGKSEGRDSGARTRHAPAAAAATTIVEGGEDMVHAKSRGLPRRLEGWYRKYRRKLGCGFVGVLCVLSLCSVAV